MDPLGDPVTTRAIQTGWEYTMDPYPSGQFGFTDDPDHEFGNGLVWTRTRTRSDGPETLLTLSMLGGLQWIKASSGLMLGMILDICRRGDSIYTAELRGPAALASYVSFVIKFFTIHQNMGPAQWGNTCWPKLTSQSWTNKHSQNSLDWLVRRWMKRLWPSRRGKDVEEPQ